MESQEIKRLDKAHIMHPWSKNDALDPMVISDVEGVYMIDSDGKRYLDFCAQLKCVNAGHKHPKIVRAIQAQAQKVCFISGAFAYEARSRLVRDLAAVTPGDLNKFFFALGGAEANENAVKLARTYTGKQKILSAYRSYHGASYGAISLTGDCRRPPVEPGIPGIVRVLNPHCYRCPFGHTHPQCGLRCAEHVREVIEYENPDTVAAFIFEPVGGANGILIPPPGYFERIREICDQHGVLMIADEVMTGFGRTGKWFGIQNWDVVPDMMTMAKGITSAYAPLSAIAISEKVGQGLSRQTIPCGMTYSAHPLGCATAVATLGVYHEENLIENACRLGKIVAAELEKMKAAHASVGDVRSIGLFSALELVKNKKTGEPIDCSRYGAEITRRLMEKGLYSPVNQSYEIHIHVNPPLTINEAQLREGLSAIDEVLEYADTLTE